jgi:hypothetical protein
MQIYHDRMKDGWSMADLDNMDFLGYLRVLAFTAGVREKKMYIDDIL